ncbi:MAG: hypothetical protein ACJ78Q_20490 [Chloroflexia bacterium]
MDLTRLPPESARVASQAAAVYLAHTAPWFVGLLIHGSALKGGIIPGSSDIDFRLYLQDSVFTSNSRLPVELSIAIHRDLAKIDTTPFSYIQCYAYPGKGRDDWVGPIPGAYHLIAGTLPLPEATPEQLLASARASLSTLATEPEHLSNGLLDHGGGRLQRHVRLLSTEVWPVLFQLLSLQQNDPIRVWNLTKLEAMQLLPPTSPPGRAIRDFHAALLAYYPVESSTEQGLAIIQRAVAFLRAARSWWEESGSLSG